MDLRGLSELLPLALIQRATGRSREAIDTLEWMEKSIRAQAGDTCWALADVLSSRCMMALAYEPLEASGRCLDRLEALAR